MGFFKKLKKWLKPKNEKIKDANRVTNYGGGVKRNDTVSEVKRSIQKAEKAKEKQQETQSGSAFKATPPSVKKAEAKDKQTSKPTRSNAFKATPPTIKHQSTALGTMSDLDAKTRLAKMNAYNENRKYQSRAADKLKPLIEAKYSGDTLESKQRIKSGEWMSDPNVAKYDVLKHPIANSLARGGLSGATFGLSEFAIAKLPKSKEAAEAERLYQANKSKGAELAGELAGSLAGFGLTGDLSKMALQKAAPKLTAKLGAGATERLAANKLVQNAARKEAIRTLGANATKEEIEHIAKSKAAKIVAALGEDAAINLTTGGASDILNAAAESDNPAEFLKNFGTNAAINLTLGTAVSALPAVRAGNADDAFIRNRLAAREGIDDLARRNRVGMGRPSDLALPKLNSFSDASEAAARYPAIEDAYLDYDGTTAAVNRYYDPDATAEAAVKRYDDLEAPRRKPRTAEEPKVEPSVPEAEVKTAPKKSKKKKTPPTREERLANSNGVDQYNARAEHQAQRFEEGYEKADNIRAVLAGEEPKAPAKGAKPAADNLKAKADATAPKAATKKEPKVVEDLGTIVNKKREKTTFRDRYHEFLSSFKTKISNSLDAFETENKKFLRTDPDKWKANNAAINNVRLSQGKAGASINDAHLAADGTRITGSHKVTINGKEHTIEHGKGLKQIFDGMDKETETKFNEYLLLKHAPDRADAGKPLFDRMNLPDGRSYNDRKACEELADKLLKDNPEFAVKAEEVYQYLREELQNRVDKGLIKQDVVDEWSKKYPFYVPTGRDGDFSGEKDIWDLLGEIKNEGNTVGAGGIKTAKGSDLPIRSIKEQLAEATTRNWRDISMNDLFRQMFGEKAGKELAEEADGGLEKVLDNTISLSKSKGGKYYAEVFNDGEAERIEIEKRFYDAIEDIYKNGKFGNALFDVPNEAFSKVSHVFKGLITTWNPIFMVKNGMRDFTEAIINTRQTKEYLQVLASGDAWREIKNGGEYWQALKDSGVLQTNFVNLEEALTKGDKIWKKPFDKFAMLQEAVETNPRLVEYMATIKKEGYDLDTGLPQKVVDAIKKDFDYDLGKGLSDFRKGKKDIPAEILDAVEKMGYDAKAGIGNVPASVRDIAAANASDVTVNFSRSGSIGKAINKGFVPFFNPSVQGYSKFIRNLSEQPSGKAVLSLLVKATALGSGATVLNNYLWGDNKNYQRISARDKATNYVVPLPVKWEDGKPKYVNVDDAEVFIKIPKSRFAAAYSLPMVNVNNDNKMGWAEMIKVAGDQVAPVDPVESNLLAPILLAHKNETWYGTPIVSDAIKNENNPSQEYDANTSWFGRQLGKATERLPKEFQISPKKADYVIDAESGVIGDFALPMATPSKQGGGNVFNKYVKHPAGNVLKRQFTIDSVVQNDLSTRFYNALGKADDNNRTDKSGKAEADEYKRLDGFSTEVAGINKAIRTLQNGKRATKQEDIYGLQKVRNQLMQDAIDGKAVPSSSKTMDAVQKYVGTTYAINNFGSKADQKAMEKYGEAKYGDISKREMRKAIDADKNFFKGVKAIGKLKDKIEKAGTTSDTTLTKAVALASVKADDDLFGAYGAVYKSRTETANKMVRSRNYFDEGGSLDEYTKLEKARREIGKLPADEESKALDKLAKRFAKGEIGWQERDEEEKSIAYNANRSYVGLATSLAQANAPERGYRLYDIKDKNIQKGINLAAMGITARDFRKMSKDLDSDGNGYPSSKEIRAYVANSDIEDKATLYDALYYYKGTYNPFGTPTKYTRAQAAAAGKKNGVEPIGGDDDNKEFNLKTETSSGSWRGGYYRYGRWHRWGSSGGGSRKGKAMDMSAFKGKNASTAKPTYKSLAENLKPANRDVRADYETSSAKYQTAKAAKSAPKPKTKAVAKKTPPKVKFKKYEV